jgi:hypothetical protein
VVPQGYRYIPEAGKKIQQISHKDELIIASAAGGPQALYYCDRKGWSFLLPESYSDEEDAIKGIRDYTNEGASYFLAAKVDDFEKAPRFKEYMFKNHNLVEYQKDKFIIFKLRQAR